MKTQFGYAISQTEEREQEALFLAYDLVRKAREIGAEMRMWAQKIQAERKFSDTRVLESTKIELSSLESKILLALKDYMYATSELLNSLKPLNPPLRAEQLKPFVDAMLIERDTTVSAMDPLTRTVGELNARKPTAQPLFAA